MDTWMSINFLNLFNKFLKFNKNMQTNFVPIEKVKKV